MTREEAQTIVSEIHRLAASEKNQIKTEFEGVHPGFDLPQTTRRIELIKKINESGDFAYTYADDELVSREEFEDCRNRWNAEVSKLNGPCSMNDVKNIEQAVGVKMGQIKSLKAIFG